MMFQLQELLVLYFVCSGTKTRGESKPINSVLSTVMKWRSLCRLSENEREADVKISSETPVTSCHMTEEGAVKKN
jgi:hypothetical protein